MNKQSILSALLGGFLLGLCLAPNSAQAQQSQCVSNALAGGTVDAITIPLQPCALSTNILILTLAGANTTTQPTLKMGGYPAQNIYNAAGTAPGVGALPGANAVVMLTSTGSAWRILSGSASTVFSGTLTVPNGGTGVTTIPPNRLMVGQGTGAITTVAAGTTGQYLIGNTGSPPSWGTVSSSLVSSWSAGTTGLTPNSATTGAVSLAGTLIAANGGTSFSSYTTGDLLYASGAAALSKLGIGSTGQYLRVTGGLPAWSALTSDAVTSLTFGTTGLTPSSPTAGAVTVAGTLVVSNGGTGKTTLTSNGVLYGNGTSALGITTAGTTGQILVGVTGSPPVFTSVPASGVSTISFGTTGLTPSTATGGIVTVAGTLGAPNGGTGFASYAVGDLLYSDTTTTLAKLPDVATGSVLISGGVGVAPSFSSVVPIGTSLALAGGTAMTANAGNGTQLVHSTGTQTSGRCVEIDSNGNHIASSAACNSGGLTAIAVKTSNYNASSNAIYCNDTTSGAVTATLPASPANNDIIQFVACSNYSTNNFIAGRNGNTIQGLAEDLRVTNNNAPFYLIFVTSYGWRLF